MLGGASSVTAATATAWCWGRFLLPPDTGVAVVNAIESRTDRRYRAADRATRRSTTHAQFAADALTEIVTADAEPAAKATGVVIHVSHTALQRGDVGPGEICRLESGDDVPVSVARAALDDAFVKAVLVDGTEVRKVKHFGRRIPAAVRTALHAEAMLRDGIVRCTVPGCDRTAGLEWHHVEPHARGGPTSLLNLEPRCPHDHRREHAVASRVGAAVTRARYSVSRAGAPSWRGSGAASPPWETRLRGRCAASRAPARGCGCGPRGG